MPVLALMCARDGKTSMGAAKLILNPWPKKPSCRDKDNNFMAPSSNGLGGRPLKSAMFGSNPTGVTIWCHRLRVGRSVLSREMANAIVPDITSRVDFTR